MTLLDTPERVRWMADKATNLRIFADDVGKMNRSLLDIGGAALVVSQFTLLGDTRKGRRPSFTGAAPPEVAVPLYELFVEELKGMGVPVETGRFGADMLVELANEEVEDLALAGPFELLLAKRGAEYVDTVCELSRSVPRLPRLLACIWGQHIPKAVMRKIELFRAA